MPVIRHLPAIKVIKGFRGIIDFYCWKNLYCVRKWPRIPYANRTAASLAAATLFGAISAGYALLGGAVKDLLAEDAADHNRTGRDLYISGVLGHLHEASMTDFLDLLTLAVAHLQTLTDLTHALASVHTDRLKVRGEDQLFSFKDPHFSTRTAIVSGANGFVDSNPIPAATIARIIRVIPNDTTSATTRHSLSLLRDAVEIGWGGEDAAFPAGAASYQDCHFYLTATDKVRVYFLGALVGDSCTVRLHGFEMTTET